MEHEEVDLEEGEIQDDEDECDTYTPLERPQTYACDIPLKRFAENVTYSESEEEPQSSESDSDSDTQKKKIKKIKITPRPLKQVQSKVKKYDIWSTRAQEDVLAETLNSCDVTIKDRSRHAESYDFSVARKYYDELEGRQGNKRTRDDRRNVNFKPRTNFNNKEKDIKGVPRLIPNLTVDITSNNEDIARDMANKLSEEREDLILKVLEAMGKEKTVDIFEETRKVEEEGGMLIMNQTRRRTPGGVFLYLVRNDYHITPEQKQMIFDEERQKYNKALKEKKKAKNQRIKNEKAVERNKLFPELLTRAELLVSQNHNIHKLKETDESNCTNPPPSPETDHHESCDGMESSQTLESQANQIKPSSVTNGLLNKLEDSRGKLKTYDDDFLDIGCDNDMDLF